MHSANGCVAVISLLRIVATLRNPARRETSARRWERVHRPPAITASSVLIPVGFDPMIHTAAKSYGQLATNVRQLVTATGEPQKVATSDDVANGLTLISPESTAVTELDMGLGGFMSYVSEFTTSLIKVSESLLEDAAFDVAGFISNSFATRYFKGLNQAIQLGSGNVGEHRCRCSDWEQRLLPLLQLLWLT